MSTLIFDTETSGLWKDSIPALDPSQPHLVQLGARLYDRKWNKQAHLTTLIRPDGWEIEAGAEKVHGISTYDCNRYGVRLAEALIMFRGMVTPATRIVGHCVQFDRKVITVAAHRAGGEGLWWSRISHKFLCTMEASTEVCGIPAEFGGFKWPSLEEAVACLCPEQQLQPKHDVDSDIDATVAIYRELLARGIVVEADPFAEAQP